MENSKLLISKRFQRRVVQIRSSRRIPNIPLLVNLPLTYNAKIGFEYEKNIISVSDIVHHHHRTQPKILFVQKTCNCSNHSQHEENVIIVLTVTECRELYVKNISCGTSYRLTHTCNAIECSSGITTYVLFSQKYPFSSQICIFRIFLKKSGKVKYARII